MVGWNHETMVTCKAFAAMAYIPPSALLTPECPGPERPAEANLSCCRGTMITCNHGYRRSALYAFHIFRKRFDFEPLLNPNSLPACSLNSTNTDFRNAELDRLHGGIVRPHVLSDYVWSDRCRWRLSFQLGKVRSHHATFLSDISAIMSMTLCARVAAFPLSVLNDVSVIALPMSDAEPYPVDTGTSPSRTRYPACLRY